jgi:hypothetical protein
VNGEGEPGKRYLACPFWRPLRGETSGNQDRLRCGSQVQGLLPAIRRSQVGFSSARPAPKW